MTPLDLAATALRHATHDIEDDVSALIAEVGHLREEVSLSVELREKVEAGLVAEVKRLRAHLDKALRLNREMYSSDEDVDSPGNMQHAVLVTALTPDADLVSIPSTTQEDHRG